VDDDAPRDVVAEIGDGQVVDLAGVFFVGDGADLATIGRLCHVVNAAASDVG